MPRPPGALKPAAPPAQPKPPVAPPRPPGSKSATGRAAPPSWQQPARQSSMHRGSGYQVYVAPPRALGGMLLPFRLTGFPSASIKSITWSKPSCLQRLYILWWRTATGSAVVVSSIPPLSVLKMWRRGDCQDGVLMATEEQWRVRRGSQAQQQPWRRLQRCQVQPGPPGLLRHGRCCQFTDPCQLPVHLSQRPTCSVSRRRRAGECDYGIHYIRIRVLATDASSNAGPPSLNQDPGAKTCDPLQLLYPCTDP